MKERILLCLFAWAFLANGAQAQGFLKKLSKAVEKVSNKVEEVKSTIEDVQTTIDDITSPTEGKKSKRTKTNGNDDEWDSDAASSGSSTILKTDPNALRISLSGGAIVTDVSLQLPSNNKEYACAVLMNNDPWTVNSIYDLQQLSQKLCYGEALISRNGTKQTISVEVPIEAEKISGKGEHLYVQAYVVDLTNAKLINKGKLTQVDEEKLRNSLPSTESISGALEEEIIGGFIGAILGGGMSGYSSDTSDDDAYYKKCGACSGSGVCRECGGKRVNDSGEECASCSGRGECWKCHGKGKIFDIPFPF